MIVRRTSKRDFFWLNPSGDPGTESLPLKTVGRPLPEGLRAIHNPPRRGRPRWSCIQVGGDVLIADEFVIPAEIPDSDGTLLIARAGECDIRLEPEGTEGWRVVAVPRDGRPGRVLANDFDQFLDALQYEEARWIVGFATGLAAAVVADAVGGALGAILLSDGAGRGWSGRHGSLADPLQPGRLARLMLYPGEGLYPEAPECRWILEAAVSPTEDDGWLAPLESIAEIEACLIHRPDPRLCAKSAASPNTNFTRTSPMTDIPPDDPEKSRFERGLTRLTAIHGNHGLGVMKSLEPICPDLAKFIIEFPFADIYTRPGLDPRSRQIATMASLVTLGHAIPELKSHIRGSLNIGITRTEIVELILQMSVYAGFPAALNGMHAAREVFAQLDAEASEKSERG